MKVRVFVFLSQKKICFESWQSTWNLYWDVWIGCDDSRGKRSITEGVADSWIDLEFWFSIR